MKIKQNEFNINDEFDHSDFISPIYAHMIKVPIWDVCNQDINPNVLNKVTFNALLVSLFNNGFIQCVCGMENKIYCEDPNVDELERINICLNGDDDSIKSGCQSTSLSDFSFANSLKDESKRKYFKYTIIDGCQRSSVIRLGTYFFITKYSSLAKSWAKGEMLPKEPGGIMCAYIAWRENFCVPMTVLDNNEPESKIKSTMLLANLSKGAHEINCTRDVVVSLYNLGNSVEWIQQNTSIDSSTIKRIIGESSLYHNDTNETKIWIPETDPNYTKIETQYIRKILTKFIDACMEDNNNDLVNSIINSHGFSSIDAFFEDFCGGSVGLMYDIIYDEIVKYYPNAKTFSSKIVWNANLSKADKAFKKKLEECDKWLQ